MGSVSTLPLIAALPIAVAAGLVSFVSPCVLPLLPGYLAFLSGATGSIEGRTGRGRAVLGSLAFIFGFAVVFVSFGAAFGGLGAVLRTHQRTLEIVFGAVTIVLGLFFAGWWPSAWLQRDRRIHRVPRVSVLGAAMLGFLFALGWTPCLGPTLAAILGLAASSSGATAIRGSILAFFYCLPRERMDDDRIAVVATSSPNDWTRRGNIANCDRRSRSDGCVAVVRRLAKDTVPGDHKFLDRRDS
jgi:cytochrome c-type biogenesis protein